jgi:DNA ligase-1
MKRFAALYAALDETNKTGDKVAAMQRYFAEAPPEDAAWAVFFLTGRKPRQVISTRNLCAWAIAAAQIPEWMFKQSYEAVGDLAETVALLLPQAPADAKRPDPMPLHRWVETRLLALPQLPEEAQRQMMLAAWEEFGPTERLVWNKLITGAFRVGVSQTLVIRALSEAGGVPVATVAHRLMGTWTPDAAMFRGLMAAESGDAVVSRPYPFMLAHPLEDPPASLGAPALWQAEWKWDGIRAQIVRRGGEVFVWSRGEELIGERFPEIALAARKLPEGTVLDGEVLPWKNGEVLPFAELQRRIGRKTLTRKILEEVPAIFLAFDVLEHEGEDIRERPMQARRGLLEAVINTLGSSTITTSHVVPIASWEAAAKLREESRSRRVEGFMLKRVDSRYGLGRVRGDWWKWKIDPYVVDAVLIYAQGGQGRRASLFTDYTFAVWRNGELVPFCKAYSGLTDEEIRRVDAFVRAHTREQFGPVRVVDPELVFEIGFEGIARSTRHKSGVAVRFPRMLRWRQDKRADEADAIERLLALLPRGEDSDVETTESGAGPGSVD